MNLPGAWTRRAFSHIGGKANEKYETAVSEISNGLEKVFDGLEKVFNEYLNEKTKELQEQNKDYKTRLKNIAEQIPEDLKTPNQT